MHMHIYVYIYKYVCKHIYEYNLYIYIYDLKIYYMFNYVDDNSTIDGLQNYLILIEKFARDWQLIISIAKTYIMHIGL